MNLNLFLIIIIALIIIFCIILWNGFRILLTVEKEKGIVEYELKATVLKIPIFKRSHAKSIIGEIEPKDEDSEENENEETEEEKSENKSSYSEEESEEKGLKERYEELKPTINLLKKSREELKIFIKDILKSINLKRLEGHLTIGLSDHATTIKIASWIWSIGAILNVRKPASLTVDPIFNEIKMDFEGKIELKINILLLIIYSLLLLTERNIRELIKELYRQINTSENTTD